MDSKNYTNHLDIRAEKNGVWYTQQIRNTEPWSPDFKVRCSLTNATSLPTIMFLSTKSMAEVFTNQNLYIALILDTRGRWFQVGSTFIVCQFKNSEFKEIPLGFPISNLFCPLMFWVREPCGA